MSNTLKLVLIRGLPGSGKSTIAAAMSGYEHLEADQFFCTPTGEYKFDPRSIKEAHAWCLAETKRALDAGYNVVVANTFTQRWELQPYLDIDEVEISEITAIGRFESVHQVPAAAIERMRRRWED